MENQETLTLDIGMKKLIIETVLAAAVTDPSADVKELAKDLCDAVLIISNFDENTA